MADDETLVLPLGISEELPELTRRHGYASVEGVLREAFAEWARNPCHSTAHPGAGRDPSPSEVRRLDGEFPRPRSPDLGPGLRRDERNGGVPCLHPSRSTQRLYTGMTDDLDRRMWEHREESTPGFVSRYGVVTLVWLGPHDTRETAFGRERRIKTRKRACKLNLVEALNPGWRDLYDAMFEAPPGPLNPGRAAADALR